MPARMRKPVRSIIICKHYRCLSYHLLLNLNVVKLEGGMYPEPMDPYAANAKLLYSTILQLLRSAPHNLAI